MGYVYLFLVWVIRLDASKRITTLQSAATFILQATSWLPIGRLCYVTATLTFRVKVCSQHMNWTELQQVDRTSHKTRSFVTRVSVTTWLAATKLGTLVLCSFWTHVLQCGCLHWSARTPFLDLEFSSVQISSCAVNKPLGLQLIRVSVRLRVVRVKWWLGFRFRFRLG